MVDLIETDELFVYKRNLKKGQIIDYSQNIEIEFV